MDIGRYQILVELISADEDLVSDMSYRNEKKFIEAVTRKIMIALAEMPHLVSVEIAQLVMGEPELAELEEELDLEEDDD